MSALLFALAGGFLALAAHPFVSYPLSLALLRRWRGGTRPAGQTPGTAPSVSLLVCAHNEERVIQDKLANLKALLDRAPAAAEALIYVDGSTDRTAEMVAAFSDPRIRLAVSTHRTGKTAGLNRLVGMASGEILVLSDANVMLAADALEKLLPHFAEPEVGLVCGHLTYTNAGESTTARNGALYWRLEEALRQLESDTGGAIGADGSLYAVRRVLWPVVPDDLIDDFFVPMMVRFGGLRVTRAGDVVAYERSAGDAGDEFRRKVRIACQAFNVHRRLWPEIRRLPALDLYKYLSHKLLKWLAGFNLFLAGLAGWLGLAAVAGWGGASGALLIMLLALVLGCLLRLPAVPATWNALTMLAAVSLGLVRSLQGEHFQTWQPALSVRSGQLSVAPESPRRAT